MIDGKGIIHTLRLQAFFLHAGYSLKKQITYWTLNFTLKIKTMESC